MGLNSHDAAQPQRRWKIRPFGHAWRCRWSHIKAAASIHGSFQPLAGVVSRIKYLGKVGKRYESEPPLRLAHVRQKPLFFFGQACCSRASDIGNWLAKTARIPSEHSLARPSSNQSEQPH